MRRRYVIRDGELVEKVDARPRLFEVMIDAYGNNPVVSPVDGKLIGSRADLRAHNERNDVVDVGNDDAFRRLPCSPCSPSEGEVAGSLGTLYDRYDAGDPEAIRMSRSGRESSGGRRIFDG